MEIDIFKVEDWCNKYEPHAKYNLVNNCIESFSVNDLLKISNENYTDIFEKKLGYCDIFGSDRLKNAITSLYNFQKHENITITHGAIGANQLVYSTLINPDDEVIVILPNYQQHYAIPKSIGAQVKYLFLKPENNWLPDVEELKSLITQKTKLISVTNPNNPTGSVIQDSLMKEIVDVSNGAYLLVDEVYRDIVTDDKYKTTSVADIYEKGIATSSLSKGFSLAGLRVGWIVGNENIIEQINKHREYNTISMSVLDDYFASIAIENKDKIFERNKQIQAKGLKILTEWIEKEPLIDCIIPRGGTVAFLKYNKNISSYDLCKKLYEDTGVLFLPGETFETDGFVRVGYCSNIEILEEALNIFSEWLHR